MRLTIITLLSICALATNAQSVFEKGYFVSNVGERTEAYIKFDNWNASLFLFYKLSVKDDIQKKSVNEINEIGIAAHTKMIRQHVNMDISGDDVNLLGYEHEPEWHKENLLLSTLVEGNINLYVFEGDGLKRFFYKKQDSSAIQLVNKRYKTTDGIKENDQFRQTLLAQINCNENNKDYFNKLAYTQQDLVNHFVAENKCKGSNAMVYALPAKLEVTESNQPQLESKPQLPPEEASNKKQPKGLNKYFSIEITPLLRQLIDLNTNNNTSNNPFTIQYATNSTQTGRGVSYGLSYGRNTFIDDSNGSRETVNRNIFFRVGYERKVSWGKKWIALHGYDLMLSGTKSLTEVPNAGITIETVSSGWGVGPRAALMYQLGGKIYIGSEATYYLIYNSTEQKITNQPNSSQKSSDFSLALPTSIFLIAKLR